MTSKYRKDERVFNAFALPSKIYPLMAARIFTRLVVNYLKRKM
jgi:hypothetical protein